MSLIVIRHMESDHNAPINGVATFAGSRVDSDLTQNGRNDAASVAEQIAAQGGCDRIYCSQMKRSHQTAELIAEKLLSLTGHQIPVTELDGIQEVDGGDFTGHTAQEIKQLFPQEAEIFYGGRIREWQFPGGESFEMVTDRLIKALDTIRQELATGQQILIVTHANTIKVLLEWLADDASATVSKETHTLRDSWKYDVITIDWSNQ